MAVDTLPDCRTSSVKAVLRTPQGNMRPIFCGNCGKPRGLIRESDVRRVFALCDDCADMNRGPDGKMLGHLAYLTEVSEDEYRRQQVLEAQRKTRAFTPQAIAAQLASKTSPLAKLAREFNARLKHG